LNERVCLELQDLSLIGILGVGLTSS